MRKIVFGIIFVTVHLLFANPFEYKHLYVDLDPDNNFYFIDGRAYYFSYPENSGNFGDYVSFTEDDITLLDSGYNEINFFGKKYYFIYGSGEAIMYFEQDQEFRTDQEIATTISLIPHIKSISESSYFSESYGGHNYVYKAENLRNMVSVNHFAAFWPRHPIPWVEGVDGPGIGEYLDIEFDQKRKNMVLLNGYVDFERTHLFKANSRVKQALITSLDENIDFEIIIDFVDEVCFQTVKFPDEVRHIRFEILDVYPGSKYNDTAVSGIFNIWEKEESEELDAEFESEIFDRIKKIDSEKNDK